jgi:hypothetical protein
MNLGDHFPKENSNEYVERNFKVGTVIKLFVHDTTPPKEKRFIIIGFTEDKLTLASLYINSELNKNINWSQEQQALQLELTPEDRDYLTTHSYVDCSKFIPRDALEIKENLLKRPEAILGNVSKSDLETIFNYLKGAPTINGKFKKRYGIFEYKYT